MRPLADRSGLPRLSRLRGASTGAPFPGADSIFSILCGAISGFPGDLRFRRGAGWIARCARAEESRGQGSQQETPPPSQCLSKGRLRPGHRPPAERARRRRPRVDEVVRLHEDDDNTELELRKDNVHEMFQDSCRQAMGPVQGAHARLHSTGDGAWDSARDGWRKAINVGRAGGRRLPLLHPLVSDLFINPLHRRPGDAEGGCLLAAVTGVGGLGVVEGIAKLSQPRSGGCARTMPLHG